MSTSSDLSFSDFTAYELPTKKWMKLISPKMRLRVRGKRHNFVSSVVKVDNRGPYAETDISISCTHWAWNVGERFPRPSFADDVVFEIFIERRFLLGYKSIRRTKSVTLDRVPTVDGDRCTLPLYDGQYSAAELEDRIEIGKITFTFS